jgi:hypothetical protein
MQIYLEMQKQTHHAARRVFKARALKGAKTNPLNLCVFGENKATFMSEDKAFQEKQAPGLVPTLDLTNASRKA